MGRLTRIRWSLFGLGAIYWGSFSTIAFAVNIYFFLAAHDPIFKAFTIVAAIVNLVAVLTFFSILEAEDGGTRR